DGQTIITFHGGIFNFDVHEICWAGAPIFAQENVNATGADHGLGLKSVIARKFFDLACQNGLGGELVGKGSIDEDPTLTVVSEFESILELSLRVVFKRNRTHPARLPASFHTTRVGGVGDHDFAAIQLHVGKKPLIALQYFSSHERGLKLH